MTADGESERAGALSRAPDPGSIRALSLDIDGTLLSPAGRVSPRTLRAVRAALAQGVLVVLCTGREYAWGVGDLARQLRLDLPAIVRNGAAVQDLVDGRVREFAFAAITPVCSKATALEEFAARQGIGMHQIMAVGDYFNDVQMLREVGWGVAMGQAPAAVRAAADAITLDNGSDGCAVAIERYVLGLHPGRRSPAVGG
jgi:hydroxymethylpyrimidine pyrophosphatase-like HAD family hydrolase